MRQSRPRGCAAALVLGTLLFGGGPLVGQRVPGGATEEAPLTLRVPALPDTVVNALYCDTTMYYPLLGIFRHLQLNAAYDSASARVSGYYIRQDNAYTLDFRTLTATTSTGLAPIPAGDFMLTGEDVFLRAPLLERLFRISTTLDLTALTVSLASPDTFPVMRAGARALSRAVRMDVVPAASPPAPLRYGRDRRLLNGLMLEYGLTGVALSGASSGLLDLRAGGEVLGGDFQGSLHASQFGGSSDVTAGDAAWHYVLETPRRWLTQVRAGSITSSGLQGVSLHGIQLTNAPIETRTLMGEQVITGLTHPDWEVELYVGDRLVGFARADATGRYRFDVPLPYGSSLISVRAYGPTGGEEVERRRSDVPLTLVPAGKLDYWIDLGRSTADRTNGGQLRAGFGASQRLTLLSGLDYLGPDSARTPIAYGGGTLRLLPNLLVSASLAPQALNQGTLFYATPGQAQLQLTLYDYHGVSAYNFLRMERQLLLSGTLPVSWGRHGATLYTAGTLADYIGGGWSVDLNVQGLLNLGAFVPTFAYRRSELRGLQASGTLFDYATAGFLYSMERPPSGLRLLRGVLASATTEYRLDTRQVSRLQGALARSVGDSHRLSVGYEFRPPSRVGRLQLRYILNLQSVQASTALEAGNAGPASVAQSLRGTTTFDPASRDWTFSGREGVGHAGAIFRFFVDADGDGVRDAGEETFAGPQIRFRQAATMKSLGDGRVRVSDLLPYYRYSVELDQSRVQNPLWSPRYARFSFVADPNAFKLLDVPFYAAGELEGTVRQGQGARVLPVGGLTIHIRRSDEPAQHDVRTFGDGSFYHPGLPPGTYLLEPDATQLGIIRAIAVPATRTLVIPPSTEGATYSGLDFRLDPKP